MVADFPVPESDPYLVNRAHDTFHVAPLTAADFTDSRPHAVIGICLLYASGIHQPRVVQLLGHISPAVTLLYGDLHLGIGLVQRTHVVDQHPETGALLRQTVHQ